MPLRYAPLGEFSKGRLMKLLELLATYKDT